MDNQHLGAIPSTNVFQKGLQTDPSPLNQPQGSYRFGLNLARGTKRGDRDVKASEHGNEPCFTLPEGFFQIGSDYIDADKKVIMAVNPDTDVSLIGIGYQDCSFESLIVSRCLNFSIEHQIQIINRVRLGCEDTIYFTDDFNPVRAINLSSLDQYHSDGYKAWLEEGKTPEGYIEEKWDCSKFSLIRGFQVPFVDSLEVTAGGSHKSGSVNFAVRLLDEDFNATPFGPESGTVNVYEDYTPSSKAYEKVHGSSNVETDPFGGSYNSGKAVNVTVTNLDTRFAYWQLAVIEAISFTGEITTIWVSPPIPLDSPTYTTTGDFNSFTQITLDELRQGQIDIQTAKTITQQENSLILGNVKGKKYDVCGFQKYASKICTEFITAEEEINDIHSPGDTKSPINNVIYGSFQGDEVVPNAIVYVWPDGDETVAYHIPGPAKDTISCASQLKQTQLQKCIRAEVALKFPCDKVRINLVYKIQGVTYTLDAYWTEHELYDIFCGGGDYSFEVVSFSAICDFYGDQNIGVLVTSEYYKTVETGETLGTECTFVNAAGEFVTDKNQLFSKWDSDVIPTWSEEIRELAPQMDVNGVPYEEWPDSQKVQRWQLFNTAISLGENYGRPGYYECRNSVYPDIRDCDGNSIWGVDACGNPLAGTPIRHPRMPDRNLIPLITGNNVDTYEYCLNIAYRSPDAPAIIEVNYSDGGVIKKIEVNLSKTQGIVPKFQEIVCSENELVYISPSFKSPIKPDWVHVVPSKSLSGSIERKKANIIGLRFSNIEYPHPDIVGHYFVTAIREEKDKTVADAGIIGRLHSGGGNVGFSYFSYSNTYADLGFYLTPEFLVNARDTHGRQIAYQGRYEFNDKEVRCTDLDGAGSVFANVDTIIDVRRQRYGQYLPVEEDFSPIEEVIPMNAISFEENYISGGDLVNLSLTNRVQILNVDNEIPKEGDDLFYAYSRLYKDVYCDLFGIVYRNNTRKILTLGDSQEVFGGDTYITPFNLNNILLRKIYDSYWDDALKIYLVVAAAAVTVLTAGAAGPALFGLLTVAQATAIATAATLAGVIGVSVGAFQAIKERYRKRQYSELARDASLNSGCSDDFLEDSFIAYAAERVEGLYVESQIPFALRQEIVGECGNLYKGEDLLEFFKQRIVTYNTDTGKYEPKPVICPEMYWLNPDFSRINEEKLYIPLPRTFKCCSDCLEEHPNRFHWSEISFQEERMDNYRVFLPNNYKDIDAQNGEIVNIVPWYEKLLITASDGLWVTVGSIQERVTGDVVSFLGTGERYQLPERKALDDDQGVVGCQHQWGVVKSKFGVLIPDENENSLYLYADGVRDLFVGNIKAWAHENFRPFLQESLKKLTGQVFTNVDNPANPDGIGIHATYDPMFRRFLITKRDYEIIEKNFVPGIPKDLKPEKAPYPGEFPVTKGSGTAKVPVNKKPLMYFIDGEFVLWDGKDLTPVSFSDDRFFRNRSVTLSYSPDTKEFVAFHSYLPLIYMRDKNTFFSAEGPGTVWRHNADNVLTFYGRKYPMIIEGVDNTRPAQDKYTDFLAFFTEAIRFDGTDFVDMGGVTFSKVVCFNSSQTTGELRLKLPAEQDILVESVTEDIDVVVIGKRGKDFYINDLWDTTKGATVALFKDDWDSIKDQYPIDKVPNVSILDAINEWDELTPLMDKFFRYRFFYTTDDDTLLLVHYVAPASYANEL